MGIQQVEKPPFEAIASVFDNSQALAALVVWVAFSRDTKGEGAALVWGRRCPRVECRRRAP